MEGGARLGGSVQSKRGCAKVWEVCKVMGGVQSKRGCAKLWEVCKGGERCV